MYKKLAFLTSLVLLLSLVAAPAKADDVNPPPWRGEPGSTMMQWTYDEDAPGDPAYPRLDAPENSSFVPHPDKIDPGNFVERAIEEGWPSLYWDGSWAYYENFAMQLWADTSWQKTYARRSGVLTNFTAGSWDIYNFTHPQPAKDLWIQITYQAMTPGPVEFGYELETFSPIDEPYWEPVEWITEGWWEEGVWIEETWYEGGWIYELFTFYDGWPEEGTGLVPFETIPLEGEWVLDKFLLTAYPNPFLEFLGLFPDVPIAIDQIVIDTICYIPEPATIALLGLGGLALLRMRRR